ncbi:hypothetical protein [Planktothricoides raciborskii]|uniref:Uncharacterized protein n=1 Tax=Planktothricoides raciborskii GIHE-MW2 TaxID=2792601 RepID=A0AAU8JJ96_9CYAN
MTLVFIYKIGNGFRQRKWLVGRGSLLRSPFTLKSPAHPTSFSLYL